MVFSSLLFVYIFLPAMLCAYYVAPRNIKNLILVLGSLVFYAWGEPIYVLLMIFISVFDYINGLLLDKYAQRKAVCRLVLTCSLVINLSVLGFFKYYGFFIDNLNALFGLGLAVKELPLPIGISFYTFQSISYIVDVYRGKVTAQKNFISYATFITLFPQLIAGPIIRYLDICHQIEKRRESWEKFGEGALLFVVGLAKKVLLANNIGLLWQSIKDTPMEEVSILSAWLGIVAFTFQIYFDFSGYSDMARGLGKMFGFEIMKNFNYPYISRSVTEFWRRWHISLGSWFREYLYIPLGGNRLGLPKQLRNLFIVWFLTGFWHGASWNFVVWGLYFGLLVTLEKIWVLKWLARGPAVVGHVYTLVAVIVGWVFFEFAGFGQGLQYIGTMFGFGAHVLWDDRALYHLSTNGFLLCILALGATPWPKHVWQNLLPKSKAGALAIPVFVPVLLVLCTAYLVNVGYNPFLYFRF
ncbi:MBOAT family O-acyltransferase [Desulforamulus ferrireducens]|uniref:Transcriptional regulator n=1 Tax=Desulforamulus ferrireducens TaxID=1833852 RepID=A0A1S6ISC3_9FIRM|nr:MBOAT family protein [Desulforamulus ferrireducens]AQS57670.1 transcriptional regulator [Desulforamulus ferrireducens]